MFVDIKTKIIDYGWTRRSYQKESRGERGIFVYESLFENEKLLQFKLKYRQS